MIEVGHFQRILLPVDFSEPCSKAAHYASWFARVGNGEIHLVHVIADPLDELYETQDVPPLQVLDHAESKARALLEALVRNCLQPDLRCQLHVRHGDPFEKILAVTEEISPQLIVLSSHGRGGLLHLVLGSVAEKIVRHSPCPVFVVPSRSQR